MKEKIVDYLKGRGYSSLGSSIKEVEVYSRQEGTMIMAVLLIDTSTFVLSIRDYQNIVNQIQILFDQKGYTRIRILGLLLVNNTENGRYIASNDEFVWLIDKQRSELVLFENSIHDYDGMREDLERIILTAADLDAKGRPVTVGSLTERLLWLNESPVTVALILINLMVFIFLSVIGSTTEISFMIEHGAMYPDYIIHGMQYWRFFTCIFLHFGMEHLLANMFSLYIFGEKVEKLIGKVRYIIMYLLSGLAGSVSSFAMSYLLGRNYVSAGASGAIFGVMGCLLAIVIKDREKFRYLSNFRIGLIIAYSIFSGVTNYGIDNAAHIGGLIMGVLLGFILYKRGGVKGED